MSLGLFPSDIVTLITVTSKAYRGWKDACREYANTTGPLKGLQIIVSKIEAESGTALSSCAMNRMPKISRRSSGAVIE